MHSLRENSHLVFDGVNDVMRENEADRGPRPLVRFICLSP
jgi:hypothetical protein